MDDKKEKNPLLQIKSEVDLNELWADIVLTEELTKNALELVKSIKTMDPELLKKQRSSIDDFLIGSLESQLKFLNKERGRVRKMIEEIIKILPKAIDEKIKTEILMSIPAGEEQ